MNTNKVIWLGLLCGFVWNCKQVTDEQPVPTETVPPAAIQALTTQFSQAEGMVFKAIEKNRVWQANFTQKSQRYTAATNLQKLLVAYQLSASAQALPDSLTNTVRNTVLEGGTFSNLRVQQYNWYKSAGDNGQFILADYEWKAIRYTFRWNVTRISGQTTYVTELLPYNQLDYRTETLADLPVTIQQALTDQAARFDYALVTIDQAGQKQYSVSVQQSNSYYILTYDENGQLQAATNPAKSFIFQTTSQLPQPIQTYLQQTPELAGFSVNGQFSLLAIVQYNGVQTYTVNLQKGRQTWLMTFDGQGKLLKRTYLNLV